MSLNVSLNEKMLNIHNHTEDAVKRGFEVMKIMNASIPELKNLESLIETVERFPNIEPIANRTYQWKECEFFGIDSTLGLIPEAIPITDIYGLADIFQHTYVFKKGQTFVSTDGFNFGTDPSGFKVQNILGSFDMYKRDQFVVFNASFTDYFINNPFIYLSNVGESHKVYIHFSYTNTEGICKQATYQIVDSDYEILGLHIYSAKDDPLSKFLLVIASNEVYTLSISDMCMTLYTMEMEGTGTTVSSITRVLPGKVTAYTMIDEDTIAVSLHIGESAQIYILEFDGITAFTSYATHASATTSFDPHTLIYVNDRDLYAIDYSTICHFTLNSTELSNTGTWEFRTPINIEFGIMIKGGQESYTPIDIVNSVIHHKNYLIFIAADAVYFATSILLTTDAHALIQDARVQIPYALGTFSHMWCTEKVLYVQGLNGDLYGLKLPDYLGNPMIASKAGLIANGMTADVSRGAIGQDMEGVSWRLIGALPSGISNGITIQYGECNSIHTLFAKSSSMACIYNILEDSIVKITDYVSGDFPELVDKGCALNDYKYFNTNYYFSGMGKIWHFGYHSSSDWQHIHFCDGDVYNWGYPGYDKNTQIVNIKELLAMSNDMIGSDDMGFILTHKSAVNGSYTSVLGPNLELLENPQSIFITGAGSKAIYEDGWFYVTNPEANEIYRTKLKWDITIIGDTICTKIEYQVIAGTNSDTYIPFLNGLLSQNLALGGIIYTPFSGYSYSESTHFSAIVLPRTDANGILYRLCNSVMYLNATSSEAYITYDAIRWYNIKNDMFMKDFANIRFFHGTHVNICIEDKNVYINGRDENAFQNYFKIEKTYDLSEKAGQFHYHFTFSPNYLFFKAIDEMVGRTVAGYVTTDKNDAKVFITEVGELGEVTSPTPIVNDEAHLITLDGQEFHFALEDVFIEPADYKITLYAFK